MNNNIDIIESELFFLARDDPILINSVKNIIINKFLTKKIYHILWHILHSFSVLYPEFPEEHERIQMISFILYLKSNLNLICSSCNQIKDTFIENSDLDLAVSSKNNLIDFFCNYHIEINTKYRSSLFEYNKFLYNRNYIIEKYSKYDYIDQIEKKYGINLFKLFKLNQINNFFLKFNEIRNIIYKEKYNFNFNFYGPL